MCFFALLDAPGILGILTDEQLATKAVLVAQESCDVRERPRRVGRRAIGRSLCVGSKEWALVAKDVTTNE